MILLFVKCLLLLHPIYLWYISPFLSPQDFTVDILGLLGISSRHSLNALVWLEDFVAITAHMTGRITFLNMVTS